ncbi:hypothetical protein L249_2928 [Ophiocordyceps polyrhachis-furcata BCC 54312]|uniref:RNA-dependent RNA polymerase n=1 Tax=Ophiocordyceps polyrhachis-furcata BCC 54312 TaxID=1330021 RepID=A0A367LSQ5_9HYPO|nr:hypothetical protein L249_2928 [Ophiocordyceps polyrhachis-furcata BCC 54312]
MSKNDLEPPPPPPPRPSKNSVGHGAAKPPGRDEGSPVKNGDPRRPASTPATAAELQSFAQPRRPTQTPAATKTTFPRWSTSNRRRDDWRKWHEVIVKVDNLPADVTTPMLFSSFSPEGRVNRIEVGDGSAKIFFEPPPGRSFWDSTFRLKHPDRRRYPEGCPVRTMLFRNDYSGRRDARRNISMGFKELQFGTMVGPTAMAVSKSNTSTDMKLQLDKWSNQLTAYFTVPAEAGDWTGMRQFRFKVPVSQISKTYEAVAADGTVSWVLPLPRPPRYFWKMDDVESTFFSGETGWNDEKTWFRATNVLSDLDAAMLHPVAIHNNMADPEYIDIGSWTTFHFVLSDQTSSRKEKDTWVQLRSSLENLNVTVVHTNDFSFRPAGKTMWDFFDHQPATSNGHASALMEMAASPVVHLPFEVRYQLEVCVSRGILNENTVTAEFLQTLAGLKPADAARRLEFLADQKEQVFDPIRALLDSDASSYLPKSRLPHYCALMRKAVITPTSVRYSSPTVETSNRVLRKYNHMQDRFLRIQFLDEEEQKRIAFNEPQNDDIWKRMMRTLFWGIRIGDRLYEFLGFGNSQLRECGAYFFCPTEHTSCDEIRKWMGDFDHIRIVAKYAARMGQCFSTTREIRGICKPTSLRIPDVERNGYCFTDGVGIISDFLASFIIQEMDLDVLDNPTAFQFRMGGSKGVLAVWPQKAKGMTVMVRESQEKFKAEFNGLEIIRCARRATATLNRQTIPILECLGVPVSAFTNLLDHQIREYELAMVDDSVAIGLLTKYVDEAQNSLLLAEMLEAGFHREGIRELFTVNLLNLWRSWTLRLLKEKARIQVEKSAFVLGCVDETGTLRGHSAATEGVGGKDVGTLPQIFLQLTDHTQCDQTEIIKGVCIVGRNPSLHPGDIRVVEAVDVPQLRHLRDEIVFPSTGDRPLPSMLSGGDLDGDDFFCIWEPSLLPEEWNFPPMNYTGLKPKELSEPVKVDDIRTFFVQYMKNDNLGLIATAHVAHSDLHGPKSHICQWLAEEHSKAVDYPKTGQPAERMGPDRQPKKWPHFMRKKPSYHSRKALGVLYDKVEQKAVEFRPDWEHAFDKRVLSKFELDDDTLSKARRLKAEYDLSVRRILTQHGVATEFELFTAWAMSAPPVGTDYKRQEQLGWEFDTLRTRFREQCYEAAGGSDPKRLDSFVAAMYCVTERETKAALAEHNERESSEDDGWEESEPGQATEPSSMPLISFPWIFYRVMIRIATGREPRARKTQLGVSSRWMPQRVVSPVETADTVASTTMTTATPALTTASTPALTPMGAAEAEDLLSMPAAQGEASSYPVMTPMVTGSETRTTADDDTVQLLDGDACEMVRRDGEADLFCADDGSETESVAGDEEHDGLQQQDRMDALFGFASEEA